MPCICKKKKVDEKNSLSVESRLDSSSQVVFGNWWADKQEAFCACDFLFLFEGVILSCHVIAACRKGEAPKNF